MTQAGTGARGWYLYGITRRASLEAALVEADACFAGDPIESAPLQVLDCSELSAVVRPVSLAEFSPAVLEERLRSASDVASIDSRAAGDPAGAVRQCVRHRRGHRVGAVVSL